MPIAPVKQLFRPSPLAWRRALIDDELAARTGQLRRDATLVGNSTLGALTIGALERLFNSLERCPRVCVVVTNPKDDVYLDGSGQVRTLIESLSKHCDRNAAAITSLALMTEPLIAKHLGDSPRRLAA